MFPFTKSASLQEIGFLGTDFHTHILPGVDDGAQTASDALEMLSALEHLGSRAIWLTPHIMERIPNSTKDLQQRFQELEAAYSGQMQLHLGAEYMLDRLFLERFVARDLLPLEIGEAPHLLIEMSMFRPLMEYRSVLERVTASGYYPLLAHPERYLYLNNEDYIALKEIGIKFQLNLYALVGGYGSQVEQRAKWLLKNGMYDITGTDTHRAEQIARFQGKKIRHSLSSLLKELKQPQN